MSERIRLADLHQDRVNPVLAEVLQNPDFLYAAERQRQLPREGLQKLDLTFASLYRRANDEVKLAAQTGDESVLGEVRKDYYQIADYYRTTGDFRIIERPQDLKLQDTYDQSNVVLHLESGDVITNPDIVDELYARGVRSIGPLYSHDNSLGGGASGDVVRGLTPLGKKVIDRMLEKGMVVDVAHANRKTAHDILERVGSYAKVMASHTALGEKQRFVDAEIIRKIANRGGLVGLTPANVFFPSMEKYVSTFVEVNQLAGNAQTAAVATDFGGLDAKHLFSELDEIGKLGLLAEHLVHQEGLRDDEVAAIMYGNVERIVKQL